MTEGEGRGRREEGRGGEVIEREGREEGREEEGGGGREAREGSNYCER